jgi:chromate transporter
MPHPAEDRAMTAPAAPPPGAAAQSPPLPSFAEAVKVWFRIGCLSFGGPAGQIALMHREVVDQRHWVSDRRFLHALNFCTLLPGPEAQQLATYLGWLMHGAKGGFAAGLLFIIPGALVMLGLSLVYAAFGDVPFIAALFFGLKCAVLVLVVEALLRVARRALKGREAWALAAVAFAALFLFNLPFPLVVLVAAMVGYFAPEHFAGGSHGKAKDGPPAALDAVLAADPGRARRLAAGARSAGLLALLAWAVPVAVLVPAGGVYADVAWFFSKMAVVTFGGAYAVLAYVAQEAVEHYQWLSASEMLAGLGLAETTPGPLILVLQFVGFLAGFRATGELNGIPGGILASTLTLWVTFAPCFVFVFLGAPLVERLQDNKRLSGALAAITAAVVGVIANLAVWFGLRVLFGELRPVAPGLLSLELPVPASLDLPALALAVLAALCLFQLKLGVLRTLGITAGAGLVLRLVAGL